MLGDDVEVAQGAGPQSIAGFAVTDPGGGADEAGQTVSLGIAVENPALFATLPAIDAAGLLSFEAVPGAEGVATITVTPSDDGGTANGGEDTGAGASFSITVLAPANTAPEITTADSFDFVEGASGPVFVAMAVDGEDDPLSFGLGGADAGLFALDDATGEVTFLTPPDFVDGGDNLLDLTLSVSDGDLGDVQAISIQLLEDSDGDLVHDGIDNATLAGNPDQLDTNGDGYGNAIDFDLDNDYVPGGDAGLRLIDLDDFLAFAAAYGQTVPGTGLGPIADADFDGNGQVGFSDFLAFAEGYGQDLGPAAIDDVPIT